MLSGLEVELLSFLLKAADLFEDYVLSRPEHCIYLDCCEPNNKFDDAISFGIIPKSIRVKAVLDTDY